MASPFGVTPATDDYDMDELLTPPDTHMDDSDQKKVARLSKTRAWKEIDKYLEGRIQVYREYLPGVNPAIEGTKEDWKVAHRIVTEIELWRSYIDEIANGVS